MAVPLSKGGARIGLPGDTAQMTAIFETGSEAEIRLPASCSHAMLTGADVGF